VTRVRHLAPTTRLLLAAVLALWLAVRLLTPAGFMPSFAGGALAIVECPEADSAPPAIAMPEMPGMDMSMPGMTMPDGHDGHGGKATFHQSCPYAPAGSIVGLAAGFAVFAVLFLVSALPPQARALLAIRAHATRDRPPSQGPPLPA
jgi:hypothetical protein